jgi:hypothetical protein
MDLTQAAREVLTRGCDAGRRRRRTNGDGVACRSDGIVELLSLAPAQRFDTARRNPCTATGWCVPYFYVLGSFHSGVRDMYDRLVDAHPRRLFVPRALGKDGSYPYYFSETHMWERMLWRGCDYGGCPRRRGAGAEPVQLSELPELSEEGDGKERVFGEVAGGALSFTWSTAHSLLHAAWDANQSKCQEPHPRTRCFPAAVEAQRAWEVGIGGGSQRQFSVPWLMRAVHGTDQVRLIALLREPVERMYSAYWFWPQYRRRYGKTPAGFTAYARQMVRAFEACLLAAAADGIGGGGGDESGGSSDGGGGGSNGSKELRRRQHAQRYTQQQQARLEHCAINFESLSAENEGVYYHADQLLKSLYVAFVPTWLKAFGRERLLILRAEDYWAGPRDILERTFDFLGLGRPPEAAIEAALAKPIRVLRGSNGSFWGDKSIVNQHVHTFTGGSGWAGHTHSRIPVSMPMEAEAKQVLVDFFRPYNAALARLMRDHRFVWAEKLRKQP